MRWTSRGHIIFRPRNPDRSPKWIATGPGWRLRWQHGLRQGGVPPPHTKCRFTAHTRAAGHSEREPMEANMYEDALKAIEGMTKSFFHSKDEFIEWLAARNPKWVQFA